MFFYNLVVKGANAHARFVVCDALGMQHSKEIM